MNKICTTVEQSKKLIELGIDVNTADMHYSTWTILNEGYILSPNQGQTIEELQEDYGNQIIPAWSLSALLELMPLINHDTVNVFKEEDGTYTALYRYTKGSPVIIKKESAIDAAFEMVVWLKENGKI